MSDKLVYTPPDSLRGFLTSDKFINLVVGPVGSTKTTASLVKIAYEAKRIAPCRDGIRRSRAIWIRQSREQLRDTSIPDFLRWYPDGLAGVYMKSEYRFILRFDDVEVDVLFRGLDDANDVRRLLSLQATFGIADEFRELNMDVFNALQARLGRYPSKADNGVGCYDAEGEYVAKFWGATNPPDYGSAWEEYLSDPPANAAAFFQPSALSPEADWLQYLPDGYYTNLVEGKSEDWVDVYVHAKFGKSLSGKPVFRAFNRELHVSKTPLRPNTVSNNPLIIGFDCSGLNPAAVLGQIGFDGRLMIFDALVNEEMGALRFVRERLKPLLANKYSGMRAICVIDPAGMQRESDERTVADIIKAEGLAVRPARTNAIPARLAAVESYLTRIVDGKSAFLIDPDGCDVLIKALAGKYRYKVKTNGEVEDKPDKGHPFSDIADSLQYLCLHADGGSIFGATAVTSRREVKPPPYRWAN